MSTAPPEIELEICWFGMKTDDEGGKVLADTREEVEDVDVEVHVRIEARGEIIPIREWEASDLDASRELFEVLVIIFPNASHNILPE